MGPAGVGVDAGGAAGADGSGGRISPGAGLGAGGGAELQAASKPRIHSDDERPVRRKTVTMWLILLEAFGAMLVLVLIVWWTMFAGRHKGERRNGDE